MDLDSRKTVPDLLNQEEIERLLAEVVAEESHATVLKTDGSREKHPKQTLQAHDFRAPGFLSPRQWRQLRLEHESFVNSLAGRLSNYLRVEMSLRLSRLETAPYRDFACNLPEPTHVALFKLEPLPGICLLETHPHLGLTIVDRLLGGAGQASSVSRDLSEIEKALLDQVLLMVLQEWCQLWSRLKELRPTILGHETSGRFLQTAADDALLIVVVLEARLGNCLEEFNLGFPCGCLEPLIRQLSPPLETCAEASRLPEPKPRWNPEFNSLLVPLAAAWPERTLTTRELTRLKVGDVLEWDPAVAAQVRLRLADAPKFIGRLGTRNGRWAVEITGATPPPPR